MAKRRRKSKKTPAARRGCGNGWKLNASKTKCLRVRGRRRKRR